MTSNIRRIAIVINLFFLPIAASSSSCDGKSDQNQVENCSYDLDIECQDDSEWQCEKVCDANSGWPQILGRFKDDFIFTATSACGKIEDGSNRFFFTWDGEGDPVERFEVDFYLGEVAQTAEYLYFVEGGYLSQWDGINANQGVFPLGNTDYHSLRNLFVFEDQLYFNFGNDPALYRYDGAGDPELVANINAEEHAVYENAMYFSGYENDTTGWELYRYDGTNPPELISDIDTAGDSSPHSLIVFQNKLFFSARDAINQGEIWSYDGVAVERVSDLPNKGGLESESSIEPVTVFNDKLICKSDVNGENNWKRVLWEYDGENPLVEIPMDEPYEIHALYLRSSTLDGEFYFIARDLNDEFWEADYLWKYDGVNPPTRIDTPSYVNDFSAYSGGLYLESETHLFLYDGVSQPEILIDLTGEELRLDYEAWFNDKLVATGSELQSTGFELWQVSATGEWALLKDTYTGMHCSCDCGD